MRLRLAREDVQVSVISPGFIASPLARSLCVPMPFMLTPEQAARVIRRGLAVNRGHIVFPWPMAVASWLVRLVHSRVFQLFAAPRSQCP